MRQNILYAGVPELAKGDRLRTCWCRPTRVRIPAPALREGKYLKCRGRIVVILRDCGSRDSGSILGLGPI